MRTSSSQAFEAFLRNPSILAMIGSAGIHGVLVLFSGLKPAESLPPPLSVISLDPGSSTTDLNRLLAPNGLPVPNGLPPINIGDVPEGPNAIDISKGSPFIGSNSNPFNVGLGGLQTTDPPQKSFLGNQGAVKVPVPKRPSTAPKKSTQSQGGQLPSGKTQTQPDYKYPGADLTRNPPNLPAGSNEVVDGFPLPGPSPTSIAIASPRPAPPSGGAAAPVRDTYVTFLQERAQFYKQSISTQTGPRLTATYPIKACSSKAQGSALVAAIFGPDGSISRDTAVQVLKSAESQTLNNAAIAEVENYRVPLPTGLYQALTFTVDIPYSDTACNPGSSPSPSTTISPSPTGTPTKPRSTPSPSARKATSKEDFLRQLEGKTPQQENSQNPSLKMQTTPSGAATQSPEPLNSPVVPDGALKSP
jgi:hypothetical protein